MQKLIIGHNALDPKTWVEAEIKGSVYNTLLSEFPEGFPHTGRIYKDHAVTANDITPKCQAEIDYINDYYGTIYVVIYPADPITIIVAVVVAVVSVVASLLLAPKIPNASQRNNQQQSANNELSARGNKSRIAGRIADIVGQVRSYPDLISVPYKVFINGIEYEVTFMCIGRGEYLIEDVREGNTLISSVEGSRVSFYAPGNSPNVGSAQLNIGGVINDPLFDIKRVDAYNGQVLVAKEAVNRGYTSYLRFSNTGGVQSIIIDNNNAYIRTGGDGLFGFDGLGSYLNDNYKAGQTVTVVDDLYGGTYTISAVGTSSITLANAVATNSNWSSLSGETANDFSARIQKPDASIIGPFVSDKKDANTFIVNTIALNGAYKEDADGQYAITIQFRIVLTPVDLFDIQIGPSETFTDTIYGSSTEKKSIGRTTYCQPSFVGRCKVQIQRITPKDTQFEGNVVDEVKVRDFYAARQLPASTEFGNVTTVHSQIKATDGALAVKERKLSALVTRKLPVKLADNTFDYNDLQPTKSFADILCFASLDPVIGRRLINQIDVENIYQVQQEILDYFSTDDYDGHDFIEFSYTFDTDNMSFEETANVICNAVLCTPFRQWNKIRIVFEGLEDNASMVFSHRNKIAGTESRAYKFGVQSEHDGVELTYVSPVDDAQMTLKVPNIFITNPKKIKTIGIRNGRQAYVMAWRIWNKLVFSYLTCEFKATGEGNVLKRKDHIIVSDNTNPVTFDGQVEDQFGLTLKLSQDIELDGNKTYYIAVQHVNKTVEIVECLPSSLGKNYVQLVNPLSFKLSFDDSNYSKSSFTIAEENLSDFDRFIVSENRINSNLTSDVTGMNYDERYYTNDQLSNNAPELDITAPGQPEPPYVPPVVEPDPVEPPPQEPTPTPDPDPEPTPNPPPRDIIDETPGPGEEFR